MLVIGVLVLDMLECLFDIVDFVVVMILDVFVGCSGVLCEEVYVLCLYLG